MEIGSRCLKITEKVLPRAIGFDTMALSSQGRLEPLLDDLLVIDYSNTHALRDSRRLCRFLLDG